MGPVMEIRIEDPRIVALPSNERILFLKEAGGPRFLSLTLTVVSMHFLIWQSEKQKGQVTLIFDFALECINSLKAKIEKVVIYDLVDNIFLSYVVVSKEGQSLQMKLHITDA